MQLIVAEKPSVARDLARVLGVPGRGRAPLEGSGRVITWCVGHLVELDEPASYDPRWKPWRLDTLPMLPERFRLRPVPGSRDQLEVVRALLRDRRFSEVVNACDAGREGELIFRYVYELAGSQLPIRRLWISSMTDEAIRAGFLGLRAGTQYDALADAARCRSEADWLVGLNATRALTVRRRSGPDSVLYSIGRVQTPTLALVVQRDKTIDAFVPRDYWELRGTFKRDSGESFLGTWTWSKVTRFGQRAAAEVVLARDRATTEVLVERLEQKKTREPPPLLFDLTSLQRTANRRFGLSASRTLEIAQALYESHKVLSYPRTDSRHLTRDVAGELPRIFRALGGIPDYAGFVAGLPDPTPQPRRVFDDARVQDHHAIIPTPKASRLEGLDRDERRIFDLVVRRFLGAFYPDAVFAGTELTVRVGAPAPPPAPPPSDERESMLEAAPPPPDRYCARGRVRLEPGWQTVAGFGEDAPAPEGKTPAEPDEQSLPAVTEGERLLGSYALLPRQTRPPPRHSEATLLSAMETAGRSIEDEALRQAMKDTGLGTPATRAATIETLLKRGFLLRQGKQLHATPLGMGLIDALPVPSLASAELTGRWEARLARIARGQEARADFMRDITGYVRETVDAIRAAPRTPPAPSAPASPAPPAPRPGPPPAPRPGPPPASRSARTAPPTVAPARPATPVARTPPATPVARTPPGTPVAHTRPATPVARTHPATPVAHTRPAPARPVNPPPARPAPTAVQTSKSPGARPARAAPAGNLTSLTPLTCPRCQTGHLIGGNRGWGCSRWREGCGFVIWYHTAGKRLSLAQLRELVTRGKTRKSQWTPDGDGQAKVEGRLVLDTSADGGARLVQEPHRA